MREFSFLRKLIDEIQNEASRKALKKVSKVLIDVGVFCGFELERLEQDFKISSKGTLCEGADFEINEVQPYLHCKNCSQDFCPEYPLWIVCPRCAGLSFQVLRGDESKLSTIA